MSLPPQRPQNPMPSNIRNRPPRSNIRFEGDPYSFFPKEEDNTPPTQGEQQTAQGGEQVGTLLSQGEQQTQESSSVGSSSLGEYSQDDKDYINALQEKFRPGLVAPNSSATNLHDLRNTNRSLALLGLPPITMTSRFEGERLTSSTRPSEQEKPFSFFPEEEGDE